MLVAARAVDSCVQVPPLGKGSMYLRPLLVGTGPTLGLQSAPEFTFVIYSAAVGAYFASGGLKPIHLKVEERYHRAAPRGVGDAKCAGAPPSYFSTWSRSSLVRARPRCQREGTVSCRELWRRPGGAVRGKGGGLHGCRVPRCQDGRQSRGALRCEHFCRQGAPLPPCFTCVRTPPTRPCARQWRPHKALARLAAATHGRVVQGKHIKTPALVGTILPGVTRKSILQLAEDAGYTVEETNVAVTEALEADEVFTSGVALKAMHCLCDTYVAAAECQRLCPAAA